MTNTTKLINILMYKFYIDIFFLNIWYFLVTEIYIVLKCKIFSFSEVKVLKDMDCGKGKCMEIIYNLGYIFLF